MITKKVTVFLFLFCLFPAFQSSAYWVWSPQEGKFINPEGTFQDESQEQYDYAMGFYKEKNLDEAADQLETLLKKYPASASASEAQYRLGTIYEEKGDYLKSFEAYKRLVESYPNSERFKEVIEREFRVANIFLSGKKAKFMGLEILPSLPKAAEVFSHITQNAPYGEFGDQAQFYLGITYKRQGRFTDAVEALQTLIDQYPQSDKVAKARYEIAEVSYKRSAAHFRDQRALDDAATQVDRYLARFSEGNSVSEAETERAEKLRQIIDEKNAEKNYRIGLYYEKQKYIQSAVIYYEDARVRYPKTKWGQKAASRLAALKSPVDYHTKKAQAAESQIKALEAQLTGLDKSEKEARKEIADRIERVQKSTKILEREKKDTFKNRRDDIKRREAELKGKFKKLENKRALAQGHPSADFKRAMDRWHASLVSEQEALAKEKQQVAGWRTSMGMDKKVFSLESLPFLGGEEVSELEKVRRIESKNLYALSKEKSELLEEKESLYKQMGEVSTAIEEETVEQVDFVAGNEDLKAQQEKVRQLRELAEVTREVLEQKEKSLKSLPGESVVAKTVAFLNPFDRKTGIDLEKAGTEELLESRMHYKEKAASQQNLVDTLTQAFDAELAMKEQKRIYESLQTGEGLNAKKLRKSIRALEKEIRSRYEEIQDRHEIKKQKVAALAAFSEQGRGSQGVLKKTGRLVTAPFVGAAKLTKAFIFGMPSERERISEKVIEANDSRASQIMEEIELESLLIEANSNEILNLERRLEILKAKASLAGGFKFRSAYVEVPYAFIGDAIESAKSMIPRKERGEILIQKLETETQKLEAYRQELAAIEAALKKKAPVRSEDVEQETGIDEQLQALEKEIGIVLTASTPAQADPKSLLKAEAQVLKEKLEAQKQAYKNEKENLRSEIKKAKALEPITKKEKKDREARLERIEKSRVVMQKSLDKIKGKISKLIEREGSLENKETEIFEKRIMHIDRVMAAVKSRAISQDLLTERDRMEERLSQISLRQDFLSKEADRFSLHERPAGGGTAR